MKLQITVVFVIILSALVFFSCGGSDSNDNTKKSSFDGSIDGQDTTNETDQVTANQFSAAIADKTITIYLMPNPSTLIYIVGETDDSNKLPGKLKIVDLTYTDGATIYTYQSGTVSLDSCPAEQGETFTGTLSNVAVKNEVSDTTKTISGNFSVTVLSVASPALTCTGGDTTDDNDNTAPQCGYSAEQCEDGVCCPFVECYNACFVSNCMSTCTDPNQMTECMTCINTCATTTCGSKMTSECDTAYSALNTCMDNNACDNLIDDEEVACATTNCCDELKAAFQK